MKSLSGGSWLFGAWLGCLLIGCSTAPAIDEDKHITDRVFLDEVARANPILRNYRGIYPAGMQVTKDAEGFRSSPYNDVASYCTIGYGHLLHLAPCDEATKAEYRQGLTEEKGAELLIIDMQLAEAAVQLSSPLTLTDGQYAALCDFVYNVGGRAYANSTLREVVNKEDWSHVSGELRRWTLAGGKPVAGLRRRREAEIRLFFDGIPRGRSEPGATAPRPPIDIETGELR